FRKGAKLDETGSKPSVYRFEAYFPGVDGDGEPDAVEVDILEDGGVLPLYPDRMQQFVELLKSGKTFTLNSLHKRGLRVKCETGSVTETSDEGGHGGGATVTGNLLEDNEDNLDREAML